MKAIAFAAVILSALACALSATALLRDTHAPATSAAVPEPNAAALQELGARIAELRSEIERSKSAKVESVDAPAQRESALAPMIVPPEVLQRLTKLEESVSALQRQAKEASIPGELKIPLLVPDAAEARRLATDPLSTEQQKLDALKALRGQMAAGKDASSQDVLLAMLELAEHSKDENTRADVYRNLHGVKDHALLDSMLRALANDPSAKVRLKVAQDIDTFLPDPAVIGALHQAADNDSDAKVRAQALTTLAGR